MLFKKSGTEESSCTYSSERSLNDDNFFPFKTKLMIMFIFMVLEIFNLS